MKRNAGPKISSEDTRGNNYEIINEKGADKYKSYVPNEEYKS